MAGTSFEEYFSIQTFLIVFRETLESAIIISVLLSFVHQTFNGNTKNQIVTLATKLITALKVQVH